MAQFEKNVNWASFKAHFCDIMWQIMLNIKAMFLSGVPEIDQDGMTRHTLVELIDNPKLIKQQEELERQKQERDPDR